MPFSKAVVRDLLLLWSQEVTWMSLHTGPPGPKGANQWESIFFERVKPTTNSLIGTVSQFDRYLQRFSATPIIVTHLAFRYSDGRVFASRSLGQIRLGNQDGIVIPEQIIIVKITERG